MECGPGAISAGCPSSLAFVVGGPSYFNFLALALKVPSVESVLVFRLCQTDMKREKGPLSTAVRFKRSCFLFRFHVSSCGRLGGGGTDLDAGLRSLGPEVWNGILKGLK